MGCYNRLQVPKSLELFCHKPSFPATNPAPFPAPLPGVLPYQQQPFPNLGSNLNTIKTQGSPQPYRSLLEGFSFFLYVDTEIKPPATKHEISVDEISFHGKGESRHKEYIANVEYEKPKLLETIEYPNDEITFYSYRSSNIESRTRKTFRSEGGFTVKKLIDCKVEFEKEDRPKTNFLGGIDCSHVFFEGLNFSERHDAYSISWGS